MDYYFNEISISRFSTENDARKALMDFYFICKQCNNWGFKALRLWNRSKLMQVELSDNFTLFNWLDTKTKKTNEEKIASQVLRSFLQKKSSSWSDSELLMLDSLPFLYVVDGKCSDSAEGIKLAHLNKTLAVSLLSKPIWNFSKLHLTQIHEDSETQVSVNHAASQNHLSENKPWIDNLHQQGDLPGDWIPTKNYFPNLEHSSEIAPNSDWQKWRENLMKLTSQQDRLAQIIETARQVANRNWYFHEPDLSACNSTSKKKRIIFSAGKGNQKIYLSVDFEKGGFEVCDFKGGHLGEYFFDGKQTQGPQANHSINVKC